MGNPISSVIGTGIGLATGSNLGGFLAGQALNSAMDGGSSGYAKPDVVYGTGDNTYTIGGNPVDTSKYFITGDKGVYNLLPMLNNAYQDQNKRDSNLGGYDTYSAINQRLAGDPRAQQSFQQAFGVQTITPTFNSKKTGKSAYQYDTSNVPSYLRLNTNSLMPKGQNKQSYVAQPAQYVDFGFGRGVNENIKNIANYASTNSNPFFMAYAPTTTANADTGLLANNTNTSK